MISKGTACASLLCAFWVTMVFVSQAHAQELVIPGQVMVVNMIDPAKQNDEKLRDSEPNLAVNPLNPFQMAASAFTPDPDGTNAPIYISIDGGRSWRLCSKLPFNYPITGTGDITLRFGTTSNVLYVAALQKSDTGNPADPLKYELRILRDKNLLCDELMELVSSWGMVDQPYVQAISVPIAGGTSEDRVYVAYSDRFGAGKKTATIQVLRDAVTISAAAPRVFKRIEKRIPCEGEEHAWDGPTRAAVHGDGKVYAAFFRFITGCGTDKLTADIVVVRDDDWGDSAGIFADLKDLDGISPGRVVAKDVSIPWTDTTNAASPRLGKQRIGGQISIGIDPSNSDRVFLAWADGIPPDNYTIHVRRSTDGGKTWSDDLRTIPNATNPSLAINSRGTVGFLYQKLVACTAAEGCWETRLEQFSDDPAVPSANLLLHQAPDNISGSDVAGPLGEYNHLMAVETDFYGVFSGNNTPDKANFPQDVKYLRKAEFRPDFPEARLLANDGSTVAASVDPFFFVVSPPIVLEHCAKWSWLCDFNPKMERGLLKLKCLMHSCTVVDLLPKNCPVKFKCPGCAPGGMCPPYYHLHLDGLKGAWRLGLLDSEGMPVVHRQFKTRNGIVVSFHPSKDKFVEGQIGSYLLAFEMGFKGKVGAEYRVKTRLTRSDRHYEPKKEKVARAPR